MLVAQRWHSHFKTFKWPEFQSSSYEHEFISGESDSTIDWNDVIDDVLIDESPEEERDALEHEEELAAQRYLNPLHVHPSVIDELADEEVAVFRGAVF